MLGGIIDYDFIPGTAQIEKPKGEIFDTPSFQPLTDFNGNCSPYVKCYSDKDILSRAVCRVEIGGFGGTGTLINNELNNTRPFLITAMHIIDHYPKNGVIDPEELLNINSMASIFKRWETDCSGSATTEGIGYFGGTLRASDRNTDFVLIELNGSPGIGDGASFAGYTRATGAPDNSSSFLLHHPLGLGMRYTKTSTVRTYLFNNNYWQAYYNSSFGAPWKGSSGAALFNQSSVIVGVLHGGWSNCGAINLSDRYGKFHDSYSNVNLRQWLSPAQDLQNLSTYSPLPVTINGPTSIPCSSTIPSVYTIPNFFGCSFFWTLTSNLTITGGQGTPSLSVQRNGAGPNNATITVRITDSKGTIRVVTVNKSVLVGAPSTPTIAILGMAPLPNTQMDVQVTANVPGPYNWYVDNILARTVSTNVTTINGGGCGDHTLKVIVTNTCGTNTASMPYTRTCSSFAVNPNPSSDIINIEPTEESFSVPAATNNFSQIEIRDKVGNLKKNQKYDAGVNRTSVDITSLAADTYIVRILTTKGWEEHKIVVMK